MTPTVVSSRKVIRMIRIVTRTVFVLGLAAASAVSAHADWQSFDQKAFDNAVSSGRSVVLDFHADWCPTCRVQAPILADLIKSETAMTKGLVAFKANYDVETMLKKQFGVQKQSTIIVFKGGKEVARSTGVTDREALAELIAKAY